MPFLHRHKIAFCHIPRTGGVSITNALQMQVEDYHYPVSYYRENYPDYFVFTVVRDYKQRIESTFGYKTPENHGDIAFENLVESSHKKGERNIGLMLKPNEHFLDLPPDYVIRYEHLQSDFDKLCQKLNLRRTKLPLTNSFRVMDIQKAIDRAENLDSNIDEVTMQTLSGLSSPKVRHLLNNLAAQCKTYLEIGCYLGGTLRAALHGNNLMYAAAIDNFSMSPQTRQEFMDNTKGLDFEFFEEDSFSFDIKKLKQPVQLYFYDGHHSVESQYKAFSHFYPAMADEFVMVVDDWDMNKVRVGTHTAIIDMKIKPIEKYELHGASGQSEELRHKTWWGGLGIFKIKKP